MSQWFYVCPICESKVEKWEFSAPVDHYRCYFCLASTPFHELPRRDLLMVVGSPPPPHVPGPVNRTASGNPGASSSVTPGSPAWDNLAGVFICGGSSYTNAIFTLDPLSTSEILRVSSFGLSVPDDATIDGIQMDFTIHETSGFTPGVMEDGVFILKGGSPGLVNKATLIEWPLIDTVRTFGGSSDLWGLSWTPADINSSGFGVDMTIQDIGGVGGGGFIDCVVATVYYTVIV